MTSRARPGNYLQLLSEAVAASQRCRFWSEKLGDRAIHSIADFENLPFTPVEEYRAQTLGSVIADAEVIEWIPGPWLGQSPDRVPVAEGPAEAKVRGELLADALAQALPDEPGGSSALVVVEGERRHFGAEVCAAFVRMGVRAHLVAESATDRLDDLLATFSPDVLVALSPSLDMRALPESVTGAVTVGRDADSEGKNHVDLLVQSELGVLGTRTGNGRYEPNSHRFHIEESPNGTLAVTPYFSRVQPVIRLDTGIPASVLH